MDLSPRYLEGGAVQAGREHRGCGCFRLLDCPPSTIFFLFYILFGKLLLPKQTQEKMALVSAPVIDPSKSKLVVLNPGFTLESSGDL